MKKEVKIKSFEDACKLLKRNPKSLPSVLKLPKDEGEYIVNTFKLSIIVKALNFDQQLCIEWKPDFTDNNYKYWPYFYRSGSGFAFGATGTDCWAATSGAGSRLCFKNRETAIYAGETFNKLYVKILFF